MLKYKFIGLYRNYVSFIRLRQNTLQLAAGMDGVPTRLNSNSEGGLAQANSALISRSLPQEISFMFNIICDRFFSTLKNNLPSTARPPKA